MKPMTVLFLLKLLPGDTLKYPLSKAHTMDESTKKKVVDQITVDDDVQFYWCILGITAHIGEEASEEVLESCVRQWVTVR